MRMSRDNDAKPCGGRIDRKLCEVMQHIEQRVGCVEQIVLWDLLSPCAAIIVSANGGHRRDRGQLIDNLNIADIPRMNDEVAAMQIGYGFGSKQAMRVGDDADPIGGSLFVFQGCPWALNAL